MRSLRLIIKDVHRRDRLTSRLKIRENIEAFDAI